MRYSLLIIGVLASSAGLAQPPAVDAVLVSKAERKMLLLSAGKPVREYRVAFGGNPVGHKQQQGDQKTPEGHYILDYKKADSAFYRAIRVSYPNAEDRARAEAAGVDPGGDIMIHGQRNGYGWWSWLSQWFNWTAGCIAVTDAEMAEIWRLVAVGTPIEIRP